MVSVKYPAEQGFVSKANRQFMIILTQSSSFSRRPYKHERLLGSIP